MLRRLALAAVLIFIAAAPANAVEPCVKLGSQVWWRAAGLSLPSQIGEHIHIDACWPEYGTIITGSTLHVDMVVTVHNADLSVHPTFLTRIRVGWRGASESIGSDVIDTTANVGITLDANGDGMRTFPLDIPIGGMATGSDEIRLNAFAGPTADLMLASTGWRVCIRSCTITSPKTIGKGWYDGHGYQNAVLTSQVPKTARSGNWTITANMNPGGGGLATVQHGIYIDPNFHGGSAGIVIRQASGSFSGSVTIDTRTLTNGPHKLVLMARDANLAGLQVIPFEVDN